MEYDSSLSTVEATLFGQTRALLTNLAKAETESSDYTKEIVDIFVRQQDFVKLRQRQTDYIRKMALRMKKS